MKLLATGLLVGAIAIGMMSCKSSTTPAGEGSLSMETSIPSATVQSMMIKCDHAEGLNCDSVRISRVRLLLSRIKLQTESDDSGTGGRDVKAGPAVITFERGKVTSVFATTVPVGRYNRIKLESHRFSPSEVVTWAADPVFGVFATAERNTVVIEGTVWNGGVATDFVQTSDNTENMTIKAEPYFEITESTATTLKFDFDAVEWLKVGGKVRDPRDGDNKNDMKLRLKTFFKLMRK
ncbi:hypothetical protein BH10BAC6_BH10BAC6_12390 [soil metagenome]